MSVRVCFTPPLCWYSALTKSILLGGWGFLPPKTKFSESWEGWNSFQAELLQATNPLSPLFPISINPPVYPLFLPLSPQLMLFYFIETLPDWRRSTGKPQGKRKNRREKAEGNYMVRSVCVMSPNLENQTSQKSKIDASVEALLPSVILRSQNLGFQPAASSEINNPKFAIKCNLLSTLNESCESHCLLAT